jgi:hypothetical protein
MFHCKQIHEVEDLKGRKKVSIQIGSKGRSMPKSGIYKMKPMQESVPKFIVNIFANITFDT